MCKHPQHGWIQDGMGSGPIETFMRFSGKNTNENMLILPLS